LVVEAEAVVRLVVMVVELVVVELVVSFLCKIYP
jgi:hypothetical protein